MGEITHDNAVQELLKRVPEIKEYSGEHSSWEHTKDQLDSPTIVFDFLGSFLLDEILSQSPREDVIKRSFNLINEMQESEDPHVQNLPQVGVFEVLAGSKKGIEVGNRLLSKNGKEWFDKIKQNFSPKD